MSALVEAPPAAALSPADVTARSGSSFLAGFACLDAERAAGMTAIYAFCRVADDAVDDAPDAATGERHLAFWRAELAAAAAGAATTPVGRAVQGAMQRFGVAAPLLGELLDGVATDLAPRPFADEQELQRYCHRVAAAVGLACLPVLGADSDGGRAFARSLGHALQLTNILRDLRSDAAAGRCYVPVPWLAADGVDAQWLRGDAPDAVYARGGPVERTCTRLGVAARARFADAARALRSLPRAQRRALVPARIMGAIYRELLSRLERRGGELRAPRARVGRGKKAWLALLVLAGVRA